MPVANPSHEVSVAIDGHIATVEMHRPPHNFFDTALVRAIGDAYHALDEALRTSRRSTTASTDPRRRRCTMEGDPSDRRDGRSSPCPNSHPN